MRAGNQRSFILLEVLFAVVLAATALFVFIDGLGRCLAAARSVQSYTVAGTLLSNKHYEFQSELATDYDDKEGRFDDYAGYSWQRVLEPTDTEHLWKQTITVYWYERGKLASEAIVEYRYLPEKPE